jgi:TolB-like protein
MAGSPREFRLGNLTLQPHRQLLRSGSPVPLGRKALTILSVLAESDGALVTKDELMAAVWPGLVIEENAVQAQIVALRKALAENATRLSTVRGVGYRLDLGERKPEAALAEAKTIAQRRSVAVLPFANLTGDASKDYLGDGMAEELISTLARASDLRVPARTSAFAYKGRNIDVREVARDLGVDAVLEGSVRAAGERIRVTAQLIDGGNGFHLWTETYDRRFEDLFALQDELAAAIASELRSYLTPLAKPTEDFEAFHLYLQAREIGVRPGPANAERGLELLKKAIARDPRFARAHAGIGVVILLGRTYHYMRAERLAEARAHAERAVALDPLLGQARSVLGTLLAGEGRWLECAEALSEAVRLDPTEPLAWSTLALYVNQTFGHLEKARENGERADALAPLVFVGPQVLCLVASCKGDKAAAQRHVARSASRGFNPDQPPLCVVRAFSQLDDGNSDEAARLLGPALAPALRRAGGDQVCIAVCRALANEAPSAGAIAAIDEMLAAPGSEDLAWEYGGTLGLILEWYVRLGALDRACGLADRIESDWKRTGFVDIVSMIMMWKPELRPFRDDPRFQSWIERMGLMPCWEHYGPPDGYDLQNGRLVPKQPAPKSLEQP